MFFTSLSRLFVTFCYSFEMKENCEGPNFSNFEKQKRKAMVIFKITFKELDLVRSLNIFLKFQVKFGKDYSFFKIGWLLYFSNHNGQAILPYS